MRAPNYNPSYYDIEKGCVNVGGQMGRSSNPFPTRIVGLTRGGLIPAVILSNLLSDTPVIPASYSSVRGNGNGKSYLNSLPVIEERKTILVIDDICDSGHTLREVVEIYRGKGHTVQSAALYYKQGAIFQPDYFWTEIPADAPWVTFPWEL